MTAAAVAVGCGLGAAILAACTGSGLAYQTVHVGEGDGGHMQVAATDDELGVVRGLPADTASPRSANDPLLEVRSWRLEGPASTLDVVAVRAREAKTNELDGGLFLVTPGGTCAANRALPRLLGDALRDAGTELGFDVTVATTGDERFKDAAEGFTKAIANPGAPDAQDRFHQAADVWRAILDEDIVSSPSDRGAAERATAAAYNLAVAHRLADGPDVADVYAAIAVLRAPTHALELDVLRNVRAIPWRPFASLLRIETLRIRQACGPAPDPDAATPMEARRRRLARSIYDARFKNYDWAAQRLELGAQLATMSNDEHAPVRASAPLFFRAAAHLYERMAGPRGAPDVICAGAPLSAYQNVLRCKDLAAALSAPRNEGCP